MVFEHEVDVIPLEQRTPVQAVFLPGEEREAYLSGG
jgi:hypothetical protein